MPHRAVVLEPGRTGILITLAEVVVVEPLVGGAAVVVAVVVFDVAAELEEG